MGMDREFMGFEIDSDRRNISDLRHDAREGIVRRVTLVEDGRRWHGIDIRLSTDGPVEIQILHNEAEVLSDWIRISDLNLKRLIEALVGYRLAARELTLRR